MLENSTALIIEEIPALYSFLEQILKQELKFGSVFIAKNGDEGLHYFKNKKIDWIFCDIELSRMNGLEVLAAIRELPNGKETPFIILTSPKNKDSISKALILGAKAFITRPFTTSSVVQKVQKLLTAQASSSTPSRDRRINVNFNCQICFEQEIEYYGEVLNMSLSGCLMRIHPFSKGGTLFDQAQLYFMDDMGKDIYIDAVLIRLEIDKAEDAEQNRIVRASFRFLKMSETVSQSMRTFLAKCALQKLSANSSMH